MKKQKKISMSESKKERLFNFSNPSKIKYATKDLSKPFFLKLSSGCSTCIKGTWSCLFINGLCTRNCFFCPQDRKMKNERNLISENITFKNIDYYMAYLKKFSFDGIGISGGEPFLVFDKLVKLIGKIRQNFGNKHYIWLYTNGDLMSKKKLQLLKNVGLNEIRFNISARNYNLDPIQLAVKYIKNVAVEIPMIPEDLEIVKSCLIELEKFGVKFLNLHQMYMTDENEKRMSKRNYSILNVGGFRAIVESELAAYDLIRFAVENKSKIGINYCSSCYKNRFQGLARRKRYNHLCKENLDSITKTGYIRKFIMKPSKKDLMFLKKHLDDNFNSDYILIKGRKTRFVLSSKCLVELLKKFKNLDSEFNIEYYDTTIQDVSVKSKNPFFLSFGDSKIFLNQVKTDSVELDQDSIQTYIDFFIKNKDKNNVMSKFLKKCKNEDISDIKKAFEDFYDEFQDLEYIPVIRNVM